MQLTVSLLYCWGDKIKMQRAGCLYVSPGAPLQGRMVTVSPSSTAFSLFLIAFLSFMALDHSSKPVNYIGGQIFSAPVE